jgi:hypothetical protein
VKVALALQVIGLALLATGAFLVAPWVGFVVAGLAAVAFGVALERGGA